MTYPWSGEYEVGNSESPVAVITLSKKRQFLPIFANFYQFLAIFTNFLQFLPTFLTDLRI